MVRSREVAFAVVALWLSACLDPNGVGNLVPPTADEDPALSQISISVSGRTRAVHLETWGDPTKPVILVLHGAPGDFRSFFPLKALTDRYLVVAWDQRGCGLSERVTKEEYTWNAIVDEIAAIKERFSPLRPVTLLGHSFGGMYAVLYATRRMSDVDQLVLLEPGGLTGKIFGDTYSDVVNINLLDPGMNEMFWQNETITADTHNLADYRLLAMLQNGHQVNEYCDADHPPPAVLWRADAYAEYMRGVRMGAPQYDFDFATGIDAFPGQVLFVAGTCSALGASFQTQYQLPLFRDARLVRIPNIGHRMLTENADAVLQALRSYLREYASK